MPTNPKPASPDRPLTVDGKTYTLRYSFRAMAALQDHYGLPSLQDVGKRLSDSESLGAADIAAILWAGLRTHHGDLSMEDAFNMLDELGLDGIQQVVSEGFAAASSDPEVGDEAKADPRKPGRSTGSSKTRGRSG